MNTEIPAPGYGALEGAAENPGRTAIGPAGRPANVRLVLCEQCGSEGRIYSGHPNDPHPRDCGPCPICEGTGMGAH